MLKLRLFASILCDFLENQYQNLSQIYFTGPAYRMVLHVFTMKNYVKSILQEFGPRKLSFYIKMLLYINVLINRFQIHWFGKITCQCIYSAEKLCKCVQYILNGNSFSTKANTLEKTLQ